MKTTLNKIRAHSPCEESWERLLQGLGKTAADDEPLWIDQILDVSDLDDALWCLRAVEGCDREIRLYAVWCVRRVQHLMDGPRSIAVLDVAERYAHGEASDAELKAACSEAREAAQSVRAWSPAHLAAGSAAWAAVQSAAWAAAAASWWAKTAVAASRLAERTAQAEELRRICREMREAKP
jgi:hypothetical protein